MTIERVNNKSVWELFGIPGGVQLFLFLNFLLLIVALIGFRQILLEEKYGNTFSLILAASGVFAFSIHSYFIMNGRTEFTQPASLALLVIILIVRWFRVSLRSVACIRRERYNTHSKVALLHWRPHLVCSIVFDSVPWWIPLKLLDGISYNSYISEICPFIKSFTIFSNSLIRCSFDFSCVSSSSASFWKVILLP